MRLLPTIAILVCFSWFRLEREPLVSGFQPCPASATATARPRGSRTPGVSRLSALDESSHAPREREETMDDFDSSPSSSSIPLDGNDVDLVMLSPEQDTAIRAAAERIQESGDYGERWYSNARAWAMVRKEYPVLEEFTPGELMRAYLNRSPRLADVLLKTPLGPLLLVNLIAIGVKWDFYQDLWFGGGGATN